MPLITADQRITLLKNETPTPQSAPAVRQPAALIIAPDDVAAHLAALSRARQYVVVSHLYRRGGWLSRTTAAQGVKEHYQRSNSADNPPRSAGLLHKRRTPLGPMVLAPCYTSYRLLQWRYSLTTLCCSHPLPSPPPSCATQDAGVARHCASWVARGARQQAPSSEEGGAFQPYPWAQGASKIVGAETAHGRRWANAARRPQATPLSTQSRVRR